jgi:diacylglycerol kinase family enzyme
VSRVRNYGGDLEIAPSISLLDDEFEVVLFEGESSLRYIKYMLGAVTRRLKNMSGVTVLRARRVAFRPIAAPIHLQVDGEYAGLLPARVDLVENALTLLVPPGLREGRVTLDASWTTSPTR